MTIQRHRHYWLHKTRHSTKIIKNTTQKIKTFSNIDSTKNAQHRKLTKKISNTDSHQRTQFRHQIDHDVEQKYFSWSAINSSTVIWMQDSNQTTHTYIRCSTASLYVPDTAPIRCRWIKLRYTLLRWYLYYAVSY